MYKMVVSLVITLGVTSGTWAAAPAERRMVYTVYPVRSCVSSAGHFVCDTAKGVAKGAVTVLEGTWGIVTAPFRVEWKSLVDDTSFINLLSLLISPEKCMRLFLPILKSNQL